MDIPLKKRIKNRIDLLLNYQSKHNRYDGFVDLDPFDNKQKIITTKYQNCSTTSEKYYFYPTYLLHRMYLNSFAKHLFLPEEKKHIS